ncbi:hypothetical protein [Gimesia maris]|nr:hypothetical protein [Gimesia maris]|tara:strand:+ start:250 stop:387 length:138 start_codon:yes stop_codon:yes gene_type:complete
MELFSKETSIKGDEREKARRKKEAFPNSGTLSGLISRGKAVAMID